MFIFWKCGTLQRITHSARIIITMSIVYHSLIAKCVTTAYTSIEKRARVERKKIYIVFNELVFVPDLEKKIRSKQQILS